ncbi:MAG TPA: ATP-binding protein [Polyangiales bacterium]|nr:ATP-binding protein [Polyangiales bacterium]
MSARREGKSGRRTSSGERAAEARPVRRVAKRKPSRPGLGEALWVPDSHAVLDVVLDLSRAITVDAHEDEIVHAYVGAFTRLFPQRMFCVRLFADHDGALSSVYATGRLRADKRERVELSREASRRHAVDEQALRRTDLRIIPTYAPLFSDGASGFDVPMMDGHELLGLISVEYPALVKVPKDDRALLVQLTLHFGGALRNARSHRRSVYLRDYLSKLLDHANAPIMVMGKLGEVRLANRAFLGVTSFHRDEVLGKPWMGFLPDAEQRRLWPVYINALRGEPATNVEVRLPRRDGSFAQVAVNAASISGPDGEVEGVMYIYRDVTELRELQEQIIQTEKLATLGQLAAGVVHELNNPLTSICFYSDYLLKKLQKAGGDEGDIEKLRRVSVSADRILKFTRDLVTYARPTIETPVALDLEQIVEQSLGFCSHVIEESGTRVSKRFAHPVPDVFGVKGQLVQVLVNLITNACHAMPLGAGLLHIETHLREARLLLTVTDTGRGIPEENLARVFEPFFTTKGEGQGTGLGLSIVRNIVEQHRGAIDVVSEVGRGTTFEISLPCRTD